MTTQTIRTDAVPSFADLAQSVTRAIVAIAAGARASAEWRRLSTLTDAGLAREGLTRDQIARAVLERNFA